MGTPKENNESKQNNSKPEGSSLSENIYSILSLGILILSVVAFKSSVLDANNIPSASMVPTLKIGDYLFVNKMRYSLLFPFLGKGFMHYDNPKRGDIVTFEPPTESSKNYVKRLIGEPGDQFRLRQISACDLQKKVTSKSPLKNGKLPTRLSTKDRDYRCFGEKRANFFHEPPILTVYEYRVKGQGPWLNYGLSEVPASKSREMLVDADEVRDVLHPDQIPAAFSMRSQLPVVYSETMNGQVHYILEREHQSVGDALYSRDCQPIQLRTTGCVIPDNHYLVMGDNRDNSTDSRFIGFIERKRFRGKVLLAYFSINWYQKVCESYAFALGQSSMTKRDTNIGFALPDFSTADQAKYCHLVGEDGKVGPLAFLKNFIIYQIPRMDVRWSRIGTLLK